MIGPHHRIAGNTQPMRQRVTPAKPQPAIHFHRTGAVQAGPLKRQEPVQRSIGEGQQFLARDHGHRATVGSGLVRRRSGIPSRVSSGSRHIVDRLLPHQHRPLRGLVPNQRYRVGNHLIPNLQWHIRNYPDRRRRAAQQQRLGRFDMRVQPRPDELIGQPLQPSTRAAGFDMPHHLGAQAQGHTHGACNPHEQQPDQYIAGDFPHHLVHFLRRQHPYPTGYRRHIDKHQRFIAEHQQSAANGLLAHFQQFIKFGLGNVLQPLLTVGLDIRQQAIQLREVVPKAVKRLTHSLKKRLLQHPALIKRVSVCVILPLRFVGTFPRFAQANFQRVNHRLIRRIQRLDVVS